MTVAVSEFRNIEVVDLLRSNLREEMIRDVQIGMTRVQKSIPAKYLYDSYGSWLFDQICQTDEYYLTRAELSILERFGARIMSFFKDGDGDLVELGSGASTKIRMLIESVDSAGRPKIRYFPVDISESAIRNSLAELSKAYEGFKMIGVVADFTRHMDVLPAGRKLITFFGSTIGNFRDDELVEFLKSVRRSMSSDDRFLLGMDMLKPPTIIEAAYNDMSGVTREFNLNLLSVLNRQLHANFDLGNFEHLAFFNKEEERIEMHLRARQPARYRIADIPVSADFLEGETIHTEISRKFSRESALKLFKRAGLVVAEWFSDTRGWFSLVELRTEGGKQRQENGKG